MVILRLLLIVSIAGVSTAAQPPRSRTGRIAGRVTYVGTLPPPVYVFESGNSQAVLALDANKGLAGAVVSVDAAASPRVEGAPEVTINQRNWWFTPAVVAVRTGQQVRFTNDDPSNHSVRSTNGVPANRFGAFTGTGQPYVHHFRANPAGAPSVITCDIHAWMLTWVYTFDHPHFSQTDGAGQFSIHDLEPRRYKLSVRYAPAGLSRDLDVTVGPGQTATADVVFETPDLALPPR